MGKYIVQYFQSQNVYTEEEAAALIDAGGVSYAEIEVTNNRAIVSGLRNTEYFYWRVQVEDNSGNLSDWSNGSAFRCFSNDTEAPFSKCRFRV